MHCYGTYRKNFTKCQNCDLVEYCKTAREPPLLGNQMSCYDDQQAVSRKNLTPRTYLDDTKKERLYTRNDLLELVSFLLGMDDLAIEYIQMYLSDSEITFQQMADQKQVTKQAVHKYLTHQCKKIPEIAELMRIGDRKKKRLNQRTFMEDVCRIKRKTHALSLKRQKKNSLCWRRLICSNQNSNLSNTSIIKGRELWRNDSKT